MYSPRMAGKMGFCPFSENLVITFGNDVQSTVCEKCTLELRAFT